MRTRTICVLTATRAEYGLLKRLIVRLREVSWFRVRVAVTGMHLAPEFGSTYREIEQDGIEIDCKIPILSKGDSPADVSAAMGRALTEFGKYFAQIKPDALVVLGDRYETMAVCIAAMNQRILIAHLHGGELTEGAVDDAIRHSITKMSYLHFTSTEDYRRRVIQLGEQPDRVYNVGAMSVENIKKQPLLSKTELEASLDFMLGDRYAVVTFHPVTLEEETVEEQMEELVKAMIACENMRYIVTKANADAGGRRINQLWEEYAERYKDRMKVVESLGMKRYLSALKYAEMVIGNSSSGITEAPVFRIPTVNIGDRQKGRLRAESILDCRPVCEDIKNAMQTAASGAFRERISRQVCPYGDGQTSEKIVAVLEQTLQQEGSELKKRFYDMNGAGE